jgi:hypothetical protein
MLLLELEYARARGNDRMNFIEGTVMKLVKLALPILAALFLASALPQPASAQFAGGGGGGGFEQMEQYAPLLEMMKKKMGKKRFATLMQTVGPMASQMMDGQGSGGFGGGGFGGGGYGGGGFDMNSLGGMMDAQTITSLVGTFDGGGKRSVHYKKAHKPGP